MTNENLKISCKELLELKSEYPVEIEAIMELLAEADEDCYMEMDELEFPMQSAA